MVSASELASALAAWPRLSTLAFRGPLVVSTASNLNLSGCAGILPPQGRCVLNITVWIAAPGSINGLVTIAADPGGLHV
jgi:hypothetical protein